MNEKFNTSAFMEWMQKSFQMGNVRFASDVIDNILKYAVEHMDGPDAIPKFICYILDDVTFEEACAFCDDSVLSEEGKKAKASAMKPNTRINYLYRDASNYKVWNEVILKGPLTEHQIRNILKWCDCGEYFIPSQVGLPEERFSEVSDDDHCWFELTKEGFTETFQKPTELITAQELYRNFEKTGGYWDDTRMDWMENMEML